MDNSQLLKHSRFWDRTGMVVAGLCLIHCILFPILIMLLPATRAIFQSPLIEGGILFSGILIGSISFTTSYRKHRLPYPMMAGLGGVAFLAFSLFVHVDTDRHLELFEIPIDPFMIVGGLLLIIGHAWNLHACHCFCDKSCHHEEHEHHHHES